jgi:glucokinase
MDPIQGAANDFFMHESGDRHDYPRLLADIGGTYARFALEQANGRLQAIFVLPHNKYPSIGDAIRLYLSQPQALVAGAKSVLHAAIAIANPVDSDRVQMTNADWAFSIESIRLEFGFETLLVVNDFTALAMSIPRLEPSQKLQVGGGTPKPLSAIGLLGSGTGLGVSGLIPTEDGWIALNSEGGHVSFSPASEWELEILRFAWKEFPHVSAERLLSGKGLELIYRAVANLSGVAPEESNAGDIASRAVAHECPICDEALQLFCAMLGTVAGNLALTLGAKGGVYIGGGIVPRLGEHFIQSSFRQRFEQKGRFSEYLAAIPTYVITAENPAFLGVSTMLAKHLNPE